VIVSAIFNRDDLPDHLLGIYELDFSGDLLAERLAGPWIRLGAWTQNPPIDDRGVEDDIMRQSILIAPGGFVQLFDKLDSVGNVLNSLGKPSGIVSSSGRQKEYSYAPFHQFDFPFTSLVGEPLVFLRSSITTAGLFTNPDLWMSLELEERAPGNGIWWDPRRGVDALIQRVIQGRMQTVEIRIDYLLRYLQARQMSLLVGHYRQLLFFNPHSSAISAFVTGELTIGSPESGSKAYLQNWGLQRDSVSRGDYLQRRLHLWFEIRPPAIDIENLWTDLPSFDAFAFTFPTKAGQVAPARWKQLHDREERVFAGETCDFMDRIYFRQEVLTKYEVSSGYEVRDNGSVANIGYWGLTRSTSRIGNELISTAIGDFAEGVPFEEWSYWKGYSVEVPSADSVRSMLQETPIPDAVNSLVRTLDRLNATFAQMAEAAGVTISDPLWRGSLDSLAGRQLKWVYPATAGDDEFIKRATLASTLFLDGLQSPSLRRFLGEVGKKMHESFEKAGTTLGSRRLLQRTTLVSALIETIQPKWIKLPSLVKRVEGQFRGQVDADLQVELEALRNCVRDEFAPLAFLYDLRIHGGLAHPPNRDEAASAAAKLGLPKGNWHRTDYLALLKLVADSFDRISAHFEAASLTMEST
jgi:hypothetical protein